SLAVCDAGVAVQATNGLVFVPFDEQSGGLRVEEALPIAFPAGNGLAIAHLPASPSNREGTWMVTGDDRDGLRWDFWTGTGEGRHLAPTYRMGCRDHDVLFVAFARATDAVPVL